MHAQARTHACPQGLEAVDGADEVTEDGASLVWQ